MYVQQILQVIKMMAVNLEKQSKNSNNQGTPIDSLQTPFVFEVVTYLFCHLLTIRFWNLIL